MMRRESVREATREWEGRHIFEVHHKKNFASHWNNLHKMREQKKVFFFGCFWRFCENNINKKIIRNEKVGLIRSERDVNCCEVTGELYCLKNIREGFIHRLRIFLEEVFNFIVGCFFICEWNSRESSINYINLSIF